MMSKINIKYKIIMCKLNENVALKILGSIVLVCLIIMGSTGCKKRTYQQACRDLDFLEAHVILDEIQHKFVTYEGGLFDNKHYHAVELEYFTALDYIYSNEILYLFNSDESNIEQRVMLLINEFPFVGRNPGEGYTEHLSSGDAEYRGVTAYIRSVESFHTVCNKILDYAILHENKRLATYVLNSFRPMPRIISGYNETIEGIKFKSRSTYIKLDKSEMNNAQRKYKEAFK